MTEKWITNKKKEQTPNQSGLRHLMRTRPQLGAVKEFLEEGGPGASFEGRVRFRQTKRSGNGILDRMNGVNQDWEAGFIQYFEDQWMDSCGLIRFPVSIRE